MGLVGSSTIYISQKLHFAASFKSLTHTGKTEKEKHLRWKACSTLFSFLQRKMSMESTRSDNSAKRSFNNNRNSASSNSNSNPSNKKKKTSQKTLGVAWGSNSRSSSRSSFSNSPFSNFGRFFFSLSLSLSLSLSHFFNFWKFMILWLRIIGISSCQAPLNLSLRVCVLIAIIWWCCWRFFLM